MKAWRQPPPRDRRRCPTRAGVGTPGRSATALSVSMDSGPRGLASTTSTRRPAGGAPWVSAARPASPWRPRLPGAVPRRSRGSAPGPADAGAAAAAGGAAVSWTAGCTVGRYGVHGRQAQGETAALALGALGVDGAAEQVGQQPGEDEQAVERGPQLVAHVGQELRLVPGGTGELPGPGLELLPRLLDLQVLRVDVAVLAGQQRHDGQRDQAGRGRTPETGGDGDVIGWDVVHRNGASAAGGPARRPGSRRAHCGADASPSWSTRRRTTCASS